MLACRWIVYRGAFGDLFCSYYFLYNPMTVGPLCGIGISETLALWSLNKYLVIQIHETFDQFGYTVVWGGVLDPLQWEGLGGRALS